MGNAKNHREAERIWQAGRQLTSDELNREIARFRTIYQNPESVEWDPAWGDIFNVMSGNSLTLKRC